MGEFISLFLLSLHKGYAEINLSFLSYAILGFALSEATGLFALMIAFLLLYS